MVTRERRAAALQIPCMVCHADMHISVHAMDVTARCRVGHRFAAAYVYAWRDIPQKLREHAKASIGWRGRWRVDPFTALLFSHRQTEQRPDCIEVAGLFECVDGTAFDSRPPGAPAGSTASDVCGIRSRSVPTLSDR